MRAKVVGVVLVAGLEAVGGVAHAQAARPTCVKQPGDTLRSNAQVRVYETDPGENQGGTQSRLWACRVGSRERVLLADDYVNYSDEQSYSSVRLAGRRVAFLLESTDLDIEATTWRVRRVDLGGGRPSTAMTERRVRLVMSGAGGVAWIESRAVRALGRSRARTLDAGPVKAGSLRPAGRSSVSWVRGGKRRTQRLR